jgi:hypothetical protein
VASSIDRCAVREASRKNLRLGFPEVVLLRPLGRDRIARGFNPSRGADA